MANPRDVNIDIVGNDKTDRATRSTVKNLDRVDRKVKDLDRSFSRSSDSIDRMTSRIAKSSDVDKFGGSVEKAALKLGLFAAAATAGVGALGYLYPALVGITTLLAPAAAALGVYGAVVASVFSKITDETTKADPATKRAADALDRLKAAWDRFIQQNAPRVVDALTRAFDMLTAVIPKLQPLFDAGADAVMRFLNYVQGKMNDGTVDRFITFLSTNAPRAIRITIKTLEAIWTTLETGWRWWGQLSSAVQGAVNTISSWVLSMKLTWQRTLEYMYKASANFLREAAAGFEKLPGIGSKVSQALNQAANGLDASAYVARQKAAQIQASIDKIQGKTVRVNIVTTETTIYKTGNGTPSAGKKVGYMSAGRGFTFAERGINRSGGPTPITVTAGDTYNRFNIALDGTPLRAMIRQEIDLAAQANAQRAKVGRRR